MMVKKMYREEVDNRINFFLKKLVDELVPQGIAKDFRHCRGKKIKTPAEQKLEI